MLIKVTFKENFKKWDGNVCYVFPKLSLMTEFDGKKYCSRQFSKFIIVYSF